MRKNEGYFGNTYRHAQYEICEFISAHYLDENGAPSEFWGDLTEVYNMLVEFIFDATSEGEIERVYGGFSKAFLRDAFVFCKQFFTKEALEANISEKKWPDYLYHSRRPYDCDRGPR